MILPVVTRPQLAASTALFVTLIGLPISFSAPDSSNCEASYVSVLSR